MNFLLAQTTPLLRKGTNKVLWISTIPIALSLDPCTEKKTLHVNKEVPDDFSQSHVTFIKKPYLLCLSPLLEEK